MNNFEGNTEIVLKYLDGELSQAEQERFETELKTNIDLQEELVNLQTAKLSLKHYGLKADVAAVHQEMMQTFKGKTLKVHRQKPFTYLFKIAASVFVVCLLALSYKFSSVQPAQIYDNQYVEYTIGTDRGTTSIPSIELAYQQHDYKRVISIYKEEREASTKNMFLAAQSYLQLKDFNSSSNILQKIIQTDGMSGAFHDDAQYYLALIYLSKPDYETAYKIFDRIYQDKTHLYHEKVSLSTLLDIKLLSLKNN